ncbi:MAG TPA: catalase family protein [Vicinamibacterales bacterium]|jgi:hypothetical protein|nr:catalase family protein [Vicinamibacterales bacterium]
MKLMQDPAETAAIERIVDSVKQMLSSTYPPGVRPMRRDAHPKHHGVVVATFRVGDDVPAALRHGLFAQPQEWTAWIRLSNSAPRVQHDLRPDVRGFALKLLNVAGPKLTEDEPDALTHDFLLASAPTFFVRNPADYVPFSIAVEKKHPFTQFFFKKGRGPELRTLLKSAIQITNPLAIPYWSQVPSRLGPHAVKYHVRPQRPHAGGSLGLRRDFLRRNMAATLRARSVTYDFLVQLQTDPIAMPIEDPVVRWDEAVSPFVKIATIVIPRQTFDGPEQMTAAEHLSYTPWRCLAEHEPLGGIQRVRRAVYHEISAMRHSANGVTRREPPPDATLPGALL